MDVQRALAVDPVEFLQLHPHAYRPFCVEESENGVSLAAVPAHELLRLHADFARQIAQVGERESRRDPRLRPRSR